MSVSGHSLSDDLHCKELFKRRKFSMFSKFFNLLIEAVSHSVHVEFALGAIGNGSEISIAHSVNYGKP